MLNALRFGHEVVGYQHHIDYEPLPASAGLVGEHHVNALEFAAFGHDLGMIEIGGMAVRKVVAYLPYQIDVGVNVGRKQTQTVRQMCPGAERFQRTARAQYLVYRVAVGDKGAAEHHIQDIVEKCRAQQCRAAVGFLLKIIHQPAGVGREMRERLKIASGHVTSSNPPLRTGVHVFTPRPTAGQRVFLPQARFVLRFTPGVRRVTLVGG